MLSLILGGGSDPSPSKLEVLIRGRAREKSGDEHIPIKYSSQDSNPMGTHLNL